MNKKQRAELGNYQTALENLKEQIASMKDAEQEKFDNFNDGLQATERGQNFENNVSDLEDIESNIESIIELLTDIIER